MPVVEKWMRDEIKRYDPNLDLVWGMSSMAVKVMGEPLPRYVVLCKTKFGQEVIMIIQDRSGNFVSPHPNIILYGNKDYGIQGIVKRDFSKNGGFKDWIRRIETQESEYKKHRRKMLKDRNAAFANEVWHSSLMNPRVYVKNPLYREA